jgi:hypothetical protein
VCLTSVGGFLLSLGLRGKSSNINGCPISFVSIMRRVLIPHEVFQYAL